MKRHKLTIIALVSVIALLIASIPGLAQEPATSAVRFVHVVPGVAAVDVYTDGTMTLQNLGYGGASGYINVPAGDHTVTVTPTGLDATLWQQTISVGTANPQTLIASSPDNPQFVAYEDNLSSLDFGNTRFLLIHAVADGPAVDVILNSDGSRIAENVSYGGSFGTFDIPANIYDMTIVPVGGDVEDAIGEVSFDLTAGLSNVAIVYGTADSPESMVVSAPVNSAGDSGLVRFAHAVVGAPGVDVLLNDALIVPNLTTDQPSPHFYLPAGTYVVDITVDGSPVLGTEIIVEADRAMTVVAIGTLESFTLDVFIDDLSTVTTETATMTVINTIPDSTAMVFDLGDGTTVASDLNFADATTDSDIAPGVKSATVEATLNDQVGTISVPDETIYGGVYYDVIVLAGDAFSGPSVVYAPTSVSQSLNSLPDAPTLEITEVTVDTPTEDTTVIDAEPVATAEEAQPATPAGDGQPVEPVAPTPAPTIVTAEAVNEFPYTGRVLLDPGARLHLRQYPSAEALSLGLVDAGDSLIVPGREGAPVIVEGVVTPFDDEEWVDPVTELTEEDEDLDPTETWLNVIYNTPDGGSIRAWSLAQYVDVRNERGQVQRLADLPTVPRNLPGSSSQTSIAPPTVEAIVPYAIVTNLDPGAALNLRRTPSTDAEVLDRLPLNTVTQLLAFNPDLDWAFVVRDTDGGGEITGWGSVGFLRFEYNGSSISIEQLLARDLVEIYEDEPTGEVSDGAEVTAPPTPDAIRNVTVATVIVDPGAALHLRRTPSVDAESLAMIPPNTQLIVEATTPDRDWLQVTYEGQTGWISSQYVALSYNGVSVPLDEADIPVVVEPEPTPEPTPEGS